MELNDFEKARRRLVDDLKADGIIVSREVEKAMLSVPRHLFIPNYIRHYAYQDTPLVIMKGQTISAPHMVAIMCELIKPRRGMRILEVGAGTGYQACVCAKAIEDGVVYSVEIDPYIALYAAINVIHAGFSSMVKVYQGDGKLGLPKHAPFDAVLVTAAASTVPQPLLDQLAVGGVIVIPLKEDGYQKLYVMEKGKEGIRKRFITYVSFVDLK
ncbi:protein-L-isoaspartate(D-aspartate) O-methyltransferase [Caldivirga sp.]|uniref:protein-L-isoaspartate(D-aspartate) O-methyltransferase n=1 Tax=Caldivirga sp. TaxID=2080243 RepID=UPI0025B8F01A|nr:protein-L-isoaspartate(D-aspartate) O-methyltransferase [Caldivirga sp.]